MTSRFPPGANGTMIVMGFEGNLVWAPALAIPNNDSEIKTDLNMGIICMSVSGLKVRLIN
jgi:hypothetical protein